MSEERIKPQADGAGREESFVVGVWLESKAPRPGDFENLSGMAGTCFPSLSSSRRQSLAQQPGDIRPTGDSSWKPRLGTAGPRGQAAPGHRHGGTGGSFLNHRAAACLGKLNVPALALPRVPPPHASFPAWRFGFVLFLPPYEISTDPE